MSSTFHERFGNRIAKTTSNGTFTRLDGSTLPRNPKFRSASATVATAQVSRSSSVQNIGVAIHGDVIDGAARHWGGHGVDKQRSNKPRRTVLSAHPTCTPSKGGGYAKQHHQRHQQPFNQLQNHNVAHHAPQQPLGAEVVRREKYAVIHPEPPSPDQLSPSGSPTFRIETRVVEIPTEPGASRQSQYHQQQQQQSNAQHHSQMGGNSSIISNTHQTTGAGIGAGSPKFYRPLPQRSSMPSQVIHEAVQPMNHGNEYSQQQQYHPPLDQYTQNQIPRQKRSTLEQHEKIRMGTNPYIGTTTAAVRPGVADLMRMLDSDNSHQAEQNGAKEPTYANPAGSIGNSQIRTPLSVDYQSAHGQVPQQFQQVSHSKNNSRKESDGREAAGLGQSRTSFLSRRGKAALRSTQSNDHDRQPTKVRQSPMAMMRSADVPSRAQQRSNSRGSHGETHTTHPEQHRSSPKPRGRRRAKQNGEPSARTRERSPPRPHRHGTRELRFEPEKQVNELPSPVRVNESLVQTEEDQLYFSRKPRHVKGFQPKSTSEYLENKPTEYYQLGKLPSDLFTDELVEKRKNKLKVKEYSERRRKENLEAHAKTTEIQNARTQKSQHVTHEARKATTSTRQRALEFARSVPPPRQSIPGPTQRNTEVKRNNRANGRGNKGDSVSPDKEVEPSLQEMERRHDRARQEIAQLRQELDMPEEGEQSAVNNGATFVDQAEDRHWQNETSGYESVLGGGGKANAMHLNVLPGEDLAVLLHP